MMPKGFTLIEMSIVLVIIGLLAAGITGGQALIEQARIRGVITDVNEIRQSFNAFELQYDNLPGDMDNATSYWPSASAGDGNADGTIARGTPEEFLFAWQHMVLSEVMNWGDFDGINTSTSSTIGVNVPGTALSGGGFDIYGDFTLYGLTGNFLSFGSDDGSIDGSIVTPPQAAGIDAKLDDGLMDTGLVLGLNGDGDTGCDNGSQEYDRTVTTVVCRLMIFLN